MRARRARRAKREDGVIRSMGVVITLMMVGEGDVAAGLVRVMAITVTTTEMTVPPSPFVQNTRGDFILVA